MEIRMRKISQALGLLLLLLSLVLPVPSGAVPTKKDDGSGTTPPPSAPVCDPDAQPPFLGRDLDPPMVMINASNDNQLFLKAYNDYVDLDNDGKLDITYKNSIDYYGYFDSYKCYAYNATNQRFEPKADVSDDWYCTDANDDYWSGNFLNWASMTRIDTIRKMLFGGHRRVDTSTDTVLERAFLPNDIHSFAKYYNGDDLVKLTPLTAATMPPLNPPTGTSTTSVAIGTGSKTFTAAPASAWIVIGDYLRIVDTDNIANFMEGWVTDFNSGTGSVIVNVTTIGGSGTNSSWRLTNQTRTGITICNTTRHVGIAMSQDVTDPPLIRMAKGNYAFWAAGEVTQCLWEEEEGGGQGLNYNDPVKSSLYAARDNPVKARVGAAAPYGDYVARVQACVPGLLGKEKCKQYPNGNYKPIGLLQVYGDENTLRFGMVAGTYGKSRTGGDIIQKIINQDGINGMCREINLGKDCNNDGTVDDLVDATHKAGDGTFKLVYQSAGGPITIATKSEGLINTWSLYRIYGYQFGGWTYGSTGAGGDNCPLSVNFFGDEQESRCSNWGNPFSEIYLSSLRYYAGYNSPQGFTSSDGSYINGINYNTGVWVDPVDPARYCTNLNVVNFNSNVSSSDTAFNGVADDLDSSNQGVVKDLGSALDSKQLTDIIGITEGITGQKWFVGETNAADATNGRCTAKTVTSFGDVRGLCPEGPGLRGGFRIAGLAYYAHMNDIRPAYNANGTKNNNARTDTQDVTTYSVRMASAPVIDIPVPGSTKKLTMLPSCIDNNNGNNGCTMADFKVITPHYVDASNVGHGKFLVIWEDSLQGSDYDLDAGGTIDYDITAGGQLTVRTAITLQNLGYSIGHGYVISGTTEDGLHIHSGTNSFNYTDPTTIAGCVNCRDTDGISIRTYQEGGTGAGLLEDPLWYAAKWGGFKDSNGNRVPDLTTEWDVYNNNDGSSGQDGIPDNYFFATDPKEVERALERTFLSILKGMASGSAASVISSSRSGEGALYQAVFWPSVGDADTGTLVKWIGEVHSLFVDTYGNTYEDTNENRQQDTVDIFEADGTTIKIHADKQVVVYYDDTLPIPETRACYVSLDANGYCPVGSSRPISAVKFLWSAAENLYSIDDGDITTNRSDINDPDDTANYISASKKRNIFTWNDLNNDGIVDRGTEILPFVANWDDKAVAIGAVGVRADRDQDIYKDFGETSQADMDTLINWVRGQDQDGMRKRGVNLDTNGDGFGDGVYATWRLGDIINSTPMLVSRPAESYHFLYKDRTYADFIEHYQDRRHVIYFGGNDGMLHAVNGGFYREKLKKFCLSDKLDVDGNCVEDVATDPALGAELWAYVPYNLAPHLKFMTSPDYCHKYYVDQRPRIFDVRIFTPDTDHPQGWGTVLVGGMRFGGTPVKALDLGLGNSDQRIFTSAYFVFDITNPEKPPVLLGEMTHLDGADKLGMTDAPMGYTTSVPTMVPMNHVEPKVTDPVTNASKWYMVFGNGPTDLKANSSLKPTFFVMPMDWLTSSPQELRFPLYTLAAENQRLGAVNGETDNGAFLLPATELCTNGRNGFVSDPITVDYELLTDYKANVVYMGTVEHNPAYSAAPDNPWYGEMYRLVAGERSYPLGSITQAFLGPMDWKVNLLIDVKRPITAPAAVGWDQTNYWVYFGTGRFFNAALDTADLTQQSYFGIKEPMVPDAVPEDSPTPAYCERKFSWATVEKPHLTPLPVVSLVHNATPGEASLMDVTNIRILYDVSTTPPTTTVEGYPAALANLFLPPAPAPPVDQFQTLVDYIAGTGGNCEKTNFGTDGWYRNFQVNTTAPVEPGDPPIFAERNLGQATLLGGLLTFTTYKPASDQECERLGSSTLYGLYYQTGTAWREPVFGGAYGLWGDEVAYKLDLGRGLAITPNLHAGGEDGTKAFVQTSTGAIVAVEQPNLPLQEGKTGRRSWFEGIPTTPAP